MKTKKTWLYMAVILTLLLILVSCNPEEKGAAEEEGGTTDTEASSSNEDPRDELRVAITASPPTLDTHISTAGMAEVLSRNIFEGLLTMNSDYQPTPMLAESVDVSEDGKTYTFQLREGVEFHNGNEMTSEDVIASMNRWMEHSLGGRHIQEVNPTFEEIDPLTVTLNLDEPMIDVLDIMSDHSQIAAIMPKEVVESAGSDPVTEYIGTGPFKFEEWSQDQHIHLSKFEDYQPVDLTPDGFSGKKEALVKDLYFEISSDSFTSISGLETGQYDIVNEISYDDYERLANNPDLTPRPSLHGNMFVVYNKQQGMFTDVEYRKAVNAALESESIMGAGYVHEDIYSLESGYMKDRSDWNSDAGKEVYNQNDPDKAQELLDELGYDGEEVRILVSSDYQHHYNNAVVMQEQLEQIGMNTQLEVYDWPTVTELREDPGAWDLHVVSSGIPSTPSSLVFLSPDWAGGIEDDRTSQLLSEMRSSVDREEAQEYWEELQDYLWNDYLPVSLLGQYSKSPVISDNIEGFSDFKGGILWNTKVVE